MAYKLFKRYSLVFGGILVITFLFILAKPLRVNAVPSQAIGTWSLNDQVPFLLRGISVISPTDGWAVGCETIQNNQLIGSVILHWDGSTWNRVTSPTTQPLFAVKMISATDVWAVGGSGTRLHWDGSTWSDYSCEGNVNCLDLYSIDFTSANDVWAVGHRIEHWDGSSWWESDSLGYHYWSVSAISATDAWIVGSYYSDYSYHGLNAHLEGETWTISLIQPFPELNAVDMLSANEGWAVGFYAICHYTGNWDCTGGWPLKSLDMLSVNDVWSVGGTTSNSESLGLIVHWDGSDWAVIDNPANKTLLSIDMLSANDGWAVGYGNILHYTNYKLIYLPLVIR